MKIVCVGDMGVDRYMPENRLLPGGITGNFTRQARRCFAKEHEIHIVSAIGNDDESKVALKAISVPGIECHIHQIEGPTPTQFIEILKSGEKNFTRYDPGVLKDFSINEKQKQIMMDADLIMTPVYWQIYNVFEKVMSIKMNGTVAVDFSDFATDPNFDLIDRYANNIDIAFFGLSKEQTELIEKVKDICVEKNILAVITLGAGGSMAINGDHSFQMPAIAIDKIIDTTGAGDAFAAGFLSCYMQDNDVEAALEKGAKVAAETIQQVGAVPS